jgi:hypothetical protein
MFNEKAKWTRPSASYKNHKPRKRQQQADFEKFASIKTTKQISPKRMPTLRSFYMQNLESLYF